MCLETKTIKIGGTNLTNVQYANNGNQVKFIDTMKYYQQSSSSLAKNASKLEKKYIRNLGLKFIQNNETYSGQFNSLVDDEKNLVLDYLCGGKEVTPYEKIKSHEDLDAVSEGDFFSKTEFYSSPKMKLSMTKVTKALKSS